MTVREIEQREIGVAVRERFGLVLLLLLGSYALTGFSDSRLARVVYVVALLLVLLVVLWSPGIPQRLRRGGSLAAIAFALGAAVASTGNEEAFGVSLLILVLLLAFAAIGALFRIAQHDHVGSQTVMGALSVYVMIGFAAGVLYWGLDVLQDRTLYEGITSDGDYLYFAIITLTTVGYGDVTPIADVSKRLAEFEALAGQIFLITLVARLVSLWGLPIRRS